MKIRLLKVGARAGQITADDSMLSRMAAAYDPRRHEAPLFVGAGGETAPAVGWVSSLSRDGDALCADIRQIPGQVEKELKEGRRQVNKVGFYADYGLRHVSLTGEPISMTGLPSQFRECEQYYEFQEGGDDMNLDDPKMKAFLRIGDEIYCGLKPKQFAEGDDPGEILHRKAMDIMMNPPTVDKYGRELMTKFDYGQAFKMACEQNPDLAAQYIQQIEDTKYRNMKPTLSR